MMRHDSGKVLSPIEISFEISFEITVCLPVAGHSVL